MLSLLFTSFSLIKSEVVLYILQVLCFFKKLVFLDFSLFHSKKNKSKNIRNVRKGLYNPLLEASKNHLALNIQEPIIAKRKKILKNFSILNEKINQIKEKKTEISKEKPEFFKSLPQEAKTPLLEMPQVKTNPLILKKILNKSSFLPSTLIKLSDFQQLNHDFIAKCGSLILNEEFMLKFSKSNKKPEISFLDIHEKYAKRKCLEKKCCCSKGMNKVLFGMKKNGFKPTILTPIIENVIYK